MQMQHRKEELVSYMVYRVPFQDIPSSPRQQKTTTHISSAMLLTVGIKVRLSHLVLPHIESKQTVATEAIINGNEICSFSITKVHH